MKTDESWLSPAACAHSRWALDILKHNTNPESKLGGRLPDHVTDFLCRVALKKGFFSRVTREKMRSITEIYTYPSIEITPAIRAHLRRNNPGHAECHEPPRFV